MRNSFAALSLCTLLAAQALLSASASDKLMTNQDVVDLVKAGMAESTVVAAVTNTPGKFDTSAQALIALSKAGVPQAVIQAMLGAGTPSTARKDVAGNHVNPEEVLMIIDGNRTQMRYVNPTVRTAARAMGWGGIGSYSVLNGPAATLRVTDRQPTFLVAVPGNAQAESYVTLVNLAVRRNNTREVMIGGGYMSYSTGIVKDRVVATLGKELEDQSQAPDGFRLYELKPQAPLAAGEYAVVFYNSQVRVHGYFAVGGDSYFDFGVDI